MLASGIVLHCANLMVFRQLVVSVMSLPGHISAHIFKVFYYSKLCRDGHGLVDLFCKGSGRLLLRYRCFGKTGIQMPTLCAGFMRNMQSWQDVSTKAIDRACQGNFNAVAHTVLRHGINYFETARGYRSSERQLGQVMSTLPREKIILQIKMAPNLIRRHS